MDFTFLIQQFGYLAIFIFLLINGIIGFPSSQIIYIFSGYLISQGVLNFNVVIICGSIGYIIGNIILYEVSRKKGAKYSIKFLKFMQIPNPEKEINKISKTLEKHGVWFLLLGKFINPIRIIIPIPAGISKFNRFLFSLIITINAFLWALIFVFIGLTFGTAKANFGWLGLIMLVLSLVFIAVFYKLMNKE